NVAVRLTVDDAGTCQAARVIVGGGVGKTPVRAVSCETVLAGKHLSPGLVAEAAEAVPSDVHPVSDHRASAKYRAALAKVFVRRTLIRALDRLEGRHDRVQGGR
ncbi:MAG: hypothetical protein ACRD24_09335, partial [Terriglobales bacterium]